jgi:ankyrin repeat protein
MAGKGLGAGKGKPAGKTSLYNAAAQGDLGRVGQALAEGAEVNELKDGMTPLLAASSGSMPNLEVVRALLDAGADPNTGEIALPLQLAASRNNLELTRLLIARGADVNRRTAGGRTALMSAIGWDNAELVEMLLDAGADPDLADNRGMTALSEAVARGDRAAQTLLHAVTTNETAERPWRSEDSTESRVERMAKGAEAGDVEFVVRMLDDGVGVDEKASYEDTALCKAASTGQLAVVEELLSREASVNLPGQAGMTPLIEAANGGHAAMVRRLLEAGADVKAKDGDGFTALHRNFGGGSSMNVEVVDLLIGAGADVNVQELMFGCTPLHLVAEHGRRAPEGVAPAIVERLMKAGADLTIKDSDQRLDTVRPRRRSRGLADGEEDGRTGGRFDGDRRGCRGGTGREMGRPGGGAVPEVRWGEARVTAAVRTLNVSSCHRFRLEVFHFGRLCVGKHRDSASGGGGGAVEMTGPDTRMDQRGDDRPVNPLPAKCPHCTMPDLDFVAEPYLLARGFTAPAETSPAEVGNFLVRDRVRKILEAAVPGACGFAPTAEAKSKNPMKDWWLAVPTRVVDMPGLLDRDKKGERCSKCGEPKLGYYYFDKKRQRFIGLDRADYGGLDVFKSKQWEAIATEEDHFNEANRWRKKDREPPLEWSEKAVGPPSHPQRWTRLHIDRRLLFSVRLEQLFKRAKVKGQLVRYVQFKDVEPTPADLAWVDETMDLLARRGLVDGIWKAGPDKAGSRPASASKWFQAFLKMNAAKKKPAKVDVAAIEKKHKLTLPQDYKDFITSVGAKSFEDVMEKEGFVARILPPKQMDFRGYRRGKMKDLLGDEESLAVDGVMFADTEHGDAFVFDVSRKDASGDYPVFWYDHEGNALEPFAVSFAECVRRFDQRS